MSNKIGSRLLALAAVCAGVVLGLVPGQALGAGPVVEVQPGKVKADGPVQFARVGASASEIVLLVESARVTIRRQGTAEEISVASNCPAHWNVTNHVIRQAAMSTTQKGVSMSADSAGARIILNGKIYPLAQGSDGSIRNLQVKDGVVTINGRQLQPLPGSDVPGNCTGPDLLEVTVPEAYAGGLTVSCRGGSGVTIDSWTGGSLIANLSGSSTLSADSLKGLEKAVIDVNGDGKARIKSLASRAFVANINGGGSVQVDNGTAQLSNATVSGAGTMTLRGKFGNLKKSVAGSGNIDVTEK